MSDFFKTNSNPSIPVIPPFTGADALNTFSKIPHDKYDVFVNGEFVGTKINLTENDDVRDVERHLKNAGFHHFQTRLTGDHYVIHTDDEAEGLKIKNELDTYLDIR